MKFAIKIIASCALMTGATGLFAQSSETVKIVDLTLFVKALNDAGLKLPVYTYSAQVTGTPSALAAGGEGEVYEIAFGHANHTGELGAVARAKSMDPVKVAAVMEGLGRNSFASEVQMRKSDHQSQQSMVVTKRQKVDTQNTYSVENTGDTFAPVKQMDPYVGSTPTSRQMKWPV